MRPDEHTIPYHTDPTDREDGPGAGAAAAQGQLLLRGSRAAIPIRPGGPSPLHPRGGGLGNGRGRRRRPVGLGRCCAACAEALLQRRPDAEGQPALVFRPWAGRRGTKGVGGRG